MIEKRDKPVVSVIMSVFNGQDYLKDAIDSILNQAFRDFEFIIIDDASTDNSKHIIDSYSDPRIVVLVNEKNTGLAGSLNNALKVASGEFIARMDADDIATGNRLEVQLKCMRSFGYDLVGSALETFGINAKTERWEFPETYDGILLHGLYSPPFAHPTVFVRTDFIRDFMYSEDYLYAEDYELWSRMLFKHKAAKVANLKEALLKYRVHVNQVSVDKNETQQKNRLVIFQENLKNLGVTSNYDAQFCLCLLSNLKFHKSQFNTLIDYLKQLKHTKKFDDQLVHTHSQKLLKRFAFEVSGSRIESRLRYYCYRNYL